MRPLAAILLGLVVAGVALAFDPGAAATGWLAAFVVVGGVPVGALVWCLIARLTGGDWAAPLRPVAWTLPVLIPMALPLAVAAVWVLPPAHLKLYLWPPLLILRGAAALLWWSWLALRLDGITRTGAALALTGHALLVSMLACDWLLVVEPGHAATVAGMILTVVQLLGGAAVALVLSLATAAARRDLTKLLIAPVLALPYMLFMDWLIVWYGNLPEHVAWYVDRTRGVSAIVPFVALVGLPGTIAAVATDWLRVAGGVAFGGTLIGIAWWLGGNAGGWLWIAVAGATLAIGGGGAVAYRYPARG